MFTKLTDFKYRRTPKEALGFYVAYLFLISLIGIIVAQLIGSVTLSLQGFDGGIRVWPIISIVSCVTLSYLIVKSKKLINKFGYILLIAISGVLAISGSPLLGLLPTVYLTTRK